MQPITIPLVFDIQIKINNELHDLPRSTSLLAKALAMPSSEQKEIGGKKTKGGNKKWTNEDIAFIEANQHLPRKELAAHFGTTRIRLNSVIFRLSKAGKLNLAPKGSSVVPSMNNA